MSLRTRLLAGLSAASLPFALAAQTPAPADPAALQTELTTLQTRLTTLRDSFLHEAAADGLTCTIPPPTIVIHQIPSYGNYDTATNTLTTPAWSQLTPQEALLFFRIVGPNATPEAARAEFETDAHQWIFVHELGHWTQACRHLQPQPWILELGANRISAAYWRQHDPALLPHMHAVFQGVVSHTPNPTPAGPHGDQPTETYFNQNYQQLGPTPAYIWYQSHMCLIALEETPTPTFAETILRRQP